MIQLNVFSKDEWRDIQRKLRPDWTDEDFERAWTEFQAEKVRRAAQ